MAEYGVLDVGSINARVAAFNKRHGDFVVDDRGWRWFADGATSTVDPMGPLEEPPHEPLERANNVLRYHRIILDRALAAFDSAKNEGAALAHARMNPGNCYPFPDPERFLANLRRLQAVAREAKKGHEKALAEKARLSPHLAMAAMAEAHTRTNNQKMLEEIAKIEI